MAIRSWPSKVTDCRRLRRRWPISAVSSVDLPAPFGPISAVTRPACAAKDCG
jgi:hypothetical protein